MALTIDSAVKLSSGASLPRIGFGVYQARGKDCEDGVKIALQAGYKHFDSAQMYHNEQLVARGLASTGVARKDLFLTTKFMPSHDGVPVNDVLSVLKQCRKNLDKFPDSGVDGGYIDLLLIHAPFGGPKGRAQHWEAFKQAQEQGWVKDIGVSNFGVKHLEALPAPTPAVNQIELHPWCQQRDIVDYCNKHGIVVQAYCPIVRAEKKRFEDPVLVSICKKHSKEPAQVLIRWSLQKGYVPLPKSVTPSRIKSNIDVYDFELDADDMKRLDGLDEGAAGACSWNPVDQP